MSIRRRLAGSSEVLEGRPRASSPASRRSGHALKKDLAAVRQNLEKMDVHDELENLFFAKKPNGIVKLRELLNVRNVSVVFLPQHHLRHPSNAFPPRR